MKSKLLLIGIMCAIPGAVHAYDVPFQNALCCLLGDASDYPGKNCTEYICTESSTTTTYLFCESCPDGYLMSTQTKTVCGTSYTFQSCIKSLVVPTLCLIGQYNDNGTCKQCPSDAYGNAGTTLTSGNNSISDCYIPSGSSFSDSTGSGTYTANCAY